MLPHGSSRTRNIAESKSRSQKSTGTCFCASSRNPSTPYTSTCFCAHRASISETVSTTGSPVSGASGLNGNRVTDTEPGVRDVPGFVNATGVALRSG